VGGPLGVNLYLNNLIFAEGIEPLKSVGCIYLGSLTFVKELKLTKLIGGGIFLRSLANADIENLKSSNPHLALRLY
jgi:hypothetical protein